MSRDKIRELAKSDANDPYYRDPLNVFDGDPGTNVTCFGYARAFKYLCDLSKFSSEKVQCRVVIVKMDGGGHACNFVTLADGKNYLVDVTNDENGNLFLKSASAGVWNIGYKINGNTKGIVYAPWGGTYGLPGMTKYIATSSLYKKQDLVLAHEKSFTEIGGATAATDVNFRAINLFVDNPQAVWKVNFKDSAYVAWKMPSQITAKALLIGTASDAAANPGRNPASWVLKGRNSTEEAWKEISRVTDGTFMKDKNSMVYKFNFSNQTAYQYYRLEITKTQGSKELCISKLGLTTN